MLAFLPIIGPILQGLVGPIFTGVTGILSKYWDTKLETTKVEASTEVSMAQESTKTIEITEQDWGVRLSRDLILFPTSSYVAIYIWDRIMDIRHPELVWGVKPLDSLPYLVGAVLTFLLGRAALYTWKK